MCPVGMCLVCLGVWRVNRNSPTDSLSWLKVWLQWREFRNFLMFKTRPFQLGSLEQICSLMMFSAIGSMFMFFRATSRNNKTSQTTPGTLTGGFCLSNARCPLYNVFCPLSLLVSTLPIPRTWLRIKNWELSECVKYLTCVTQQYFTQQRLH